MLTGLQTRAADADVALRLSVWRDNLAARRLYDQLGFVEHGEVNGYLSMVRIRPVNAQDHRCYGAADLRPVEGEQVEEISHEGFAERLDQPFVLRRHDAPDLGEPIAAVLVDCSNFLDNGRSTGYDLTLRTALSTPAEQANYLTEADGIPRRPQPTPRRMRMCHE